MGEYNITKTASSKLRERLDYPVIDTDAHISESKFVFPDFLKQVGGADIVERYNNLKNFGRPGEAKSVFWGGFSGDHTIDRATTMLPKLYARRLEEAGIDFCTLYSTMGFRCQVIQDDEIRQASCRALNMMYTDMFKDHSDRMTPAALIPMHTPDEAIAELEFAVGELGMKAIMTANEVLRPHPVVAAEAPHLAQDMLTYSPLALDSTYDYDPFWAKCVELKVVPAGHSINYSGTHASPSNYVYNRLGLFATFAHASARGLFMSGITRKFPELNIAFLECGVWWAAALYNDLVEFWEKRNAPALKAIHDPAKIDFGLLEEMFARYGNDYLTPERLMGAKAALSADGRTSPDADPDFIDDWTALNIEKAEDIKDLFTGNFYFGCEADDAMNYTAFNGPANKFGARLKAMFSSDIGHWDVPDIGAVLHEAHEQVDRGLMTDEDFQDFVFTNPVTFQTRANPDFFKGTRVEGAVEQFLTDRGQAA